ncbi:MAG: TonB-dependent receptor [Thermodesulfovibrionales bacterium]
MKRFYVLFLSLILILGLAGAAYATNGDNLIGIGPIARSMGGVGIAAPQDAISAVFANPAAMCFGPYCPGSQFDFAGTVFDPKVTAKVTTPMGTVTSDSQFEPFVIPAVGISTGIGAKGRFGIAAYGVSGLGVDYRGVDFFPDALGAQFAGTNDIYTQLQIMKFAPNFAYLLTDNFSVGASVHVNFANLDLQNGSSHDYSMGVQLGAIYKMGPVSLGLNYVSPQEATHRRVADLDMDGSLDALDLESPQKVGFGVAYEAGKLLVEGNVTWVNWSDASGYDAFDWDDQWVYAIGAQFKPVDRLALRAGFNYAENPVNEHAGWNPAGAVNIQGKMVPEFNYEFLRTIGFPAIVESHLTLGVGYEITDRLIVNAGYMHAFENSISESDVSGSFKFESELSEDSVEFGLSWRF